jgi:hypothetical protein
MRLTRRAALEKHFERGIACGGLRSASFRDPHKIKGRGWGKARQSV